MKTCSLCASTMENEVQACPRCGIAARATSAAGGRVARALRTLSVAMLGVATLGVLAVPLVRAARGAVPGVSGCEPHSWSDWNLAIERSCVTPAYVCEHMTSAKLLQDPALAGELSDAARSGKSYARDHLDALVGHVRGVYGCDGATTPHAPGTMEPAQRLPPGHPPIPSSPGSPMFDAPETVTI